MGVSLTRTPTGVGSGEWYSKSVGSGSGTFRRGTECPVRTVGYHSPLPTVLGGCGRVSLETVARGGPHRYVQPPDGAVAHRGERLDRTQSVTASSPRSSMVVSR